MSTNDKRTNTNYKNQKNKMPHRFQKSNQETKLVNDDIDLLPQHQQNLSKIVKSYRSSQDIHLEVEKTTLVNTAKNLLETQTNAGIDSLNGYLDQLKEKLNNQNATNVDDSTKVEVENNETIIKVEDSIQQVHINEQVNINDILYKSEKEIINTVDQKSLLKSLIDDINSNSSIKTNTDDAMLEHNISEIVNEDSSVEEVEEITPVNNIAKPVAEKKLLYSVFLIIFLVILVVMGYLYKDIFLEFFDKFF